MDLPTPVRGRIVLVTILLLAALAFLVIELIALLPYLGEFKPTDYLVLRGWGEAAQHGNWFSYYPLPTLLYVFLPISLFPSWFVWIWTAAPFGFLLYLFRKQGIVAWLYVTTIVQAAWGQLD